MKRVVLMSDSVSDYTSGYEYHNQRYREMDAHALDRARRKLERRRDITWVFASIVILDLGRETFDVKMYEYVYENITYADGCERFKREMNIELHNDDQISIYGGVDLMKNIVMAATHAISPQQSAAYDMIPNSLFERYYEERGLSELSVQGLMKELKGRGTHKS